MKGKSVRVGNGCGFGFEQELRDSRVTVGIVRNVGIDAVEVKLAARPGWLQSGEFHVLPLEAGLEGVLAIDLGDIIGQLERRADLVRRQEGVAAQCLQAADTKSRQSTVFVLLRDVHDAVIRGETTSARSRQVVGLRRHSGGMEVIQSCTNDIDQSR